MLRQSETIIDKLGKILLFSVEDFCNKIVLGNNCFICGADNRSKFFNDEHIIPDWILRKYSLHNQHITLPNSALFKYDRYKIPCCRNCNSLLGEKIEKPVSNLLKLSYSEICHALSSNEKNISLLYTWLMLIFFKVHLKDNYFSKNLNHQKGDLKIGDSYDWSEMHHIHCVIRKDYTNAIIDRNIIGTIFVVPAFNHKDIVPFDYTDNYAGKVVMLRLDEFCIFCVLNDSCGVFNLFYDSFKKINGPLTPFQLKELFTHLVYINLRIKERPVFFSSFSSNGNYNINAIFPDIVELVPESEFSCTRGELLFYYCKDLIGPIENREKILDEIKNGKRRYLFDNNGDFINFRKEFD